MSRTNDNWADIFSKILVARVEPNLGIERPTILCEYPRCEAALARATPHDPRVAERFELYVCGVELANGFGELTDPIEQRARFEAEMTEKQRIYGERYPIDEDFLAALSHMPPASGVALGFDRLVMLATGARRDRRCVLWTLAPVRTRYDPELARMLPTFPRPDAAQRQPGRALEGAPTTSKTHAAHEIGLEVVPMLSQSQLQREMMRSCSRCRQLATPLLTAAASSERVQAPDSMSVCRRRVEHRGPAELRALGVDRTRQIVEQP